MLAAELKERDDVVLLSVKREKRQRKANERQTKGKRWAQIFPEYAHKQTRLLLIIGSQAAFDNELLKVRGSP